MYVAVTNGTASNRRGTVARQREAERKGTASRWGGTYRGALAAPSLHIMSTV